MDLATLISEPQEGLNVLSIDSDTNRKTTMSNSIYSEIIKKKTMLIKVRLDPIDTITGIPSELPRI